MIKFKTEILNSSLCDCSDAYIPVTGIITVANILATVAPTNNVNEKVMIKHFDLFTEFISEINNTQIDNANDIDVLMSMFNLLVYSNKMFFTMIQKHLDVYGNIIEMNLI